MSCIIIASGGPPGPPSISSGNSGISQSSSPSSQVGISGISDASPSVWVGVVGWAAVSELLDSVLLVEFELELELALELELELELEFSLGLAGGVPLGFCFLVLVVEVVFSVVSIVFLS